jgi:hypothetical protein
MLTEQDCTKQDSTHIQLFAHLQVLIFISISIIVVVVCWLTQLALCHGLCLCVVERQAAAGTQCG